MTGNRADHHLGVPLPAEVLDGLLALRGCQVFRLGQPGMERFRAHLGTSNILLPFHKNSPEQHLTQT